jgi:endonuclease/exonuclease/phosphatase family metal-dependent hydrolase
VRVVEASPVRFAKRPGLHRRGAVLGVLELHDRHLTVLGTHLDLDAPARRDTAMRLRALVPAVSPPLLVGADVNELPGGPAWSALSAGLVDVGAEAGPTFPQRDPGRRIDGVFADPVLGVQAVLRPDPGPASDHLPLVVDLTWP